MPFRPSRRAALALGLAAIAQVARAQPSSASAALSTAMPGEVGAALDAAQVPAEALAAFVQEVGGNRPLFAWRADEPANPASVMKLFTTLAALDRLGPAWAWTTPVWLQGEIRDATLDGPLVIKGSGDPKFVLERVWMLLRRVRQFGVRHIAGDIVLDRSAFAVPEQSPAEFDGEPRRPYNVRPDALLFNYKSEVLTFTPDVARNVARVAVEPPLADAAADAAVALVGGGCDDWRAALRPDLTDPRRTRFGGSYALACGEKQWALADADPATYNERLLTHLWRELGGTFGGRVRDGLAPVTRPTFELTSPPLADVVRDINKFSNNVMAQQLFLTLALQQRGVGTPQAARAELKAWMAQRLGRGADAAVIDNGSGLSRDTRVSARLIGRLLLYAWGSPVMPELMASLPVTGLDGTLRNARMSVGRAHLKTGTLRDVTALAGYVLSRSGRRYVVAAVVNHDNAPQARPALDALVQWVAGDLRAAPPAP